MLELELAGHRELQRLREQLAPLPPGLEIPRGGLGQQVALALRLIGSGSCPPVLQLAQGGYDTHSGQANRHGRVLAELAKALAAFAAGLEHLPNRPQLTLLAVSEFGRLHRPAVRRPAARPLPRHLPQPHRPRRPRRPDRRPQPTGAVPAGVGGGVGVTGSVLRQAISLDLKLIVWLNVEQVDAARADGKIVLTPVNPNEASVVRARLAELGISDVDVTEAVSWARRV